MIRPMLAVPSSGASNRQPILLTDLAGRGEWIAQEKVDGIRAILYQEGDRVRLVNRSMIDITARFPEIARVRLPAGDVVLDGEIVARDGLFSTVATRDKQTGAYAAAAKANPCYFKAFDFLRSGGQSLMTQPLHTRLTLMRGVIGNRRIVRPVRQSGDILGLWNEVVAAGGEGIIVKLRKSFYLPGERASSWVKFKAVQRLTAIAAGYEQGQRRDFGAILLALLGEDGPIPIGKVGTGWSAREEAVLQGRLDAGEMFAIEVDALNRTRENTLRFPVYRGQRTDLPITAATADQLALLPVY
jgi:bifunctional non-homologous end joining protein LigD